MTDLPDIDGQSTLDRWLGDRRIRYVLAGGVSSVLYYVCFAAGWLSSGGRMPYLLLAFISNGATAVVSYPLYRAAFAETGAWLAGFLRFYAVFLGGLIFTMCGLPILVELLGAPVLIAQALLVLAWPLVNYQVLRLWAFQSREGRRPVPDRSDRVR
jgi:putative flippase GtrA